MTTLVFRVGFRSCRRIFRDRPTLAVVGAVEGGWTPCVKRRRRCEISLSCLLLRGTVPNVNRRCARPACRHLAATTLSFLYAQQMVWIDDLHAEDSPANHDLCTVHADRTNPPRGWDLNDRRLSRQSAAEPQVDTPALRDGPRRLRRAG